MAKYTEAKYQQTLLGLTKRVSLRTLITIHWNVGTRSEKVEEIATSGLLYKP